MKINKEIIARLDIHVLTLLTLKDITTVEVLVQEDFLVGVNELILSTAKTNPAVLTNYIIWRVLAAFYPDRPADSSARCVHYSTSRHLSRDVLFCFLSEVPVTNWAPQ